MALPQGIDVSNHQRHVDWQAVAGAGKVFAFIKAGGDVGFVDPYFHDNWAGAKRAGLLRGAYWYYDPSQDAYVEARRFCNVMGTLEQGDLQPALDLEISSGVAPDTLIQKTRMFTQTVKAVSGRDLIIYTYPSFYQHALHDSANFHDLALWIASYRPDRPTVPGQWPRWSFWQYADRGACSGVGDGVNTPCLLDAFNGTLTQLRKFAGY